MKLYFVTGNANKAREVAQIIPDVEQIDIDLPEIQSLDAHEVIAAKLQAAHEHHPDKTIVVEDISYEIAGLNGLPGTLVKWFIERLSVEGLYELVKDKDATTKVIAHVGMINPNGEMTFVQGEVVGKTVEVQGDSGFAFDRIFIPNGYAKRYSEMSTEEKNAISHRSIAWSKLKDTLEK